MTKQYLLNLNLPHYRILKKLKYNYGKPYSYLIHLAIEQLDEAVKNNQVSLGWHQETVLAE